MIQGSEQKVAGADIHGLSHDQQLLEKPGKGKGGIKWARDEIMLLMRHSPENPSAKNDVTSICPSAPPHLFEGCKCARIVLFLVSTTTSLQWSQPLFIERLLNVFLRIGFAEFSHPY